MRRRFAVLLVSSAVALLVGYFLAFSPIFLIEETNIVGVETPQKEKLQRHFERILNEKRAGVFPQRNSLTLFLTAGLVASRLREEVPEIADLTIRSSLTHTAHIEATARTLSGIWCEAEKPVSTPSVTSTSTPGGAVPASAKEAPRPVAVRTCYFIDAHAIPFAVAPQLTGTVLLRVHDIRNRPITLRTAVIESDTFQFLDIFRTKLGEELKLPVSVFMLSDEDVEAHIVNGPRILFTFERSPEYLLAAIRGVRHKAGKDASRIASIDLRIPDRAYYRLRDASLPQR